MTARPHLLIVVQSRGGTTRALVDAAFDGARDPAIVGVDVTLATAVDTTPDDVLAADALLLGTSTHFGSMAGLTKDLFERLWHPLLDRTRGLPFALLVKGDTDASGTVRGIEPLVTGLGWRWVRPPLVVVGPVGQADLDAAYELGATMAASLA